MTMASTECMKPFIEIKNLTKLFPVRGGLFQTVAWVRAVEDVSFNIYPGEILGIVGESGCGKTTLGRTMLNLIHPTSGEVLIDGKNIFAMNKQELHLVRRQMQMIFQDPYGSLSPRMPIGEQIIEGLTIHKIATREEREHIMRELMAKVGLQEYHARRYAHEFSGGQLQRIGIARALALNPRFILCDEPVSALDVSIQAQVLNLLRDLRQDFGLTYAFIAHNLSVVEHISDRVAVMYLGQMVELAPVENIYDNPQHPYTQAILSAVPIADPDQANRKRLILQGDVPSPVNPPSACRFHPRCPLAIDKCSQIRPPTENVAPAGEKEHLVACWRHGESVF